MSEEISEVDIREASKLLSISVTLLREFLRRPDTPREWFNWRIRATRTGNRKAKMIPIEKLEAVAQALEGSRPQYSYVAYSDRELNEKEYTIEEAAPLLDVSAATLRKFLRRAETPPEWTVIRNIPTKFGYKPVKMIPFSMLGTIREHLIKPKHYKEIVTASLGMSFQMQVAMNLAPEPVDAQRDIILQLQKDLTRRTLERDIISNINRENVIHYEEVLKRQDNRYFETLRTLHNVNKKLEAALLEIDKMKQQLAIKDEEIERLEDQSRYYQDLSKRDRAKVDNVLSKLLSSSDEQVLAYVASMKKRNSRILERE